MVSKEPGIRGCRRIVSRAIGNRARFAALAVAMLSSGWCTQAFADALPARITPLSLAVESSGALPDEVRSLEAETAAWAFDRDTVSEHTAFDVSRIVADFEDARDITRIKVFGPAPYRLSVEAHRGGAWNAVEGLQELDLTGVEERWRSFPAAQPVTTTRLRFTLEPVTDAPSTGLRELEVWGNGARAAVAHADALVTAFDEDRMPPHARDYKASPAQIAVAPDNEGGTAGTFTFQLDRRASDFQRAYLVYDIHGLMHWTGVLRAINDHGGRGGWPADSGDKWVRQVEQVNPDWLRTSDNTVAFSVPAEGGAGYTVRNLRLIGELADGSNFVETLDSTGEDGDANRLVWLRDGDPDSGWTPYAGGGNGAAATLGFDRRIDLEAVEVLLAYQLSGEVALDVLHDGEWITTGNTIEGDSLASGWNRLPVATAAPVQGVRLRLSDGAGSSAEIRELIPLGSGIGPRHNPPRIRVLFPDSGQYRESGAYLRGYIQPADNGSGTAELTVAGRQVGHATGEFEALVDREQAGYGDRPAGDPWSVELTATYPDGETVIATVDLTEQLPPASTDPNAQERIAPPYSERIPPGLQKKLRYDEAELDIGAEALAREAEIHIRPLHRSELPDLDTGMTNTTRGPRAGYRFLPHGQRFQRKVRVRLPYSQASIPPGHTAEDIHTFYFDEEAGRWVALERVEVDTARQEVISYTDHFTDMITATVTVPDHPAPVSFNPTSIKDIRAADPGAGINLIEPPTANNRGDARLAYPLELPPGRLGMQPQLAVQYNSSGGNGWMGEGWDIPVQAITIDTRWGAPRYEDGLETETYLLNGEQLTPVAHRGELQPRTAEKVFHARVEGEFREIIRHGDHPANYWWEVTDKNGVKYFYGGDPVIDAPQANSTLTNGGGDVFLWTLREMRDTNGNFVRYHYARVSDLGVDGGTVPGTNLYLQRISYTGHGSTEGSYSVTFVRDRELGEARRPDVQIDARGGFKRVTADLLRRVDVALDNELIRRFEFEYNENPYGDGRPALAFNKTTLTSVTQVGADGTDFNTHTFTYYDDARNADGNYRGFAGSTSWSIGNDNISAGLLGRGLASALGGSRSTSRGGHVYAGVGACCNVSSKRDTAGFKVGFSRSRSETLITMADMNGDRLPDKVFRGSGGFFYRPNLSGPNGQNRFGDRVELPTLPAISRENVTSTTIGAQSYFGLPVLADRNRAITQADTYFSDVNGDGLTDLVSGGRVLFGYVNAGGVPTFSANSALTPVPVGAGAVDIDGLLEDADEIEAERAAMFPLMDTVRRWVAPYDGVIQINAPVQLIEDTSDERAQYDGADGVRVAIQLEDDELWATSIDADDYGQHEPTGVSTIPVSRGQRLYFRVQSVFDGAYDRVAWDPMVSYVDVETSRTDVNDLNVYSYRASEDFTLAGRRGTVTLPLTGTLHLAGQWEKTGVTTDDVTLLITRNGSEVFRQTLGFNETASVDLSQDLEVNQLDELEWHILADSPVDVGRIRLSPRAWYVAADGVDSVKDEDGNFILEVKPPYDMDLYPVNALDAPQESYTVSSTISGDETLPVNATLSVSGLAFGERTSAVFTVKRRGALLAKQTLEFVGTSLDEPVTRTASVSVPVTVDDELFFDVSSRDISFPTRLTQLDVTIPSNTEAPPVPLPVALHTPAADGLFPQPYRGWGVAGYNGNSPRDTRPINQSLLVLDESYDPENARVYPFAPDSGAALWGAVDEFAWVKAAGASSSRLGLDDIRMLRAEQFAGASAVPRISRSINNSVSAGISGSRGDSSSQLDFQDLNGDGFPDVIGQGRVQYTRAVGGLAGSSNGGVGLGSARRSETESFGASTDGAASIAAAIASARGDVAPDTRTAMTAKIGMDMPSFSANVGTGSSETQFDLIDINGDGLPDKVFRNGTAALNLGYRFAPPEPWGGGIVNDGRSLDAGGGINLGYNQEYHSIAGGLSLNLGMTRSDEIYVDVNGDGLPDKITNGTLTSDTVRFNTGAGFTDPVAWPGGHGNVAVDKHISLSGGAYFTFGSTIPLPPIKFVINPGINYSTSMGRPEIAFRDMDGDGFVDHVASTRDNELKVALNPIGRTNRLKAVHRPLGATITLDYTRDGNTFEMPQSRWVMSRVDVVDGHPGDGVDTRTITLAYDEPLYSRQEREFYGYAEVRVQERNAADNDALYRESVQIYLNNSFYTKGLLESELMRDGAGNPFQETVHTYQLFDVHANAELMDPNSTTATAFPQRISTEQRIYEGLSSPGVTTRKTFVYDGYGNVVDLRDTGDVGSDDDVQAEISYFEDTDAYIVGTPNRIVVRGQGRVLARREAEIEPGTGNLRQVREYLEDGRAAVTDLGYDGFGNLARVTGPQNGNGERYTIALAYDPVVNTFVAAIRDSFGYASTATHDLRFGQPQLTTDINGNDTLRLYDAFGRVTHVYGPYQMDNGRPVDPDRPTIGFAYHPDATVPWALTRHLDRFRDPGDPIETVLFTDGLKRVLQTKKDTAVHGPNGARDVMVVSGRLTFDHVGRTVEQYYPVTEPLGRPGEFNPAFDTVQPIRTAFDVLDRVVRTTLPDDTSTALHYGFGADRDGLQRLLTRVTDANGVSRWTYRDVRERITAVREQNAGRTLWTSYAYDPLDRITAVLDAAGHRTTVAYDGLGRRTAIDNPDTGRTEHVFDLAGNRTATITANLRAQGEAIRYAYDFNRLTAITYPEHPENNVHYEYGAPGASGNSAGRITHVVDAAGEQWRGYGRLGEVIQERRRIASRTEGASANSPEVYTTEYLYDSWGRLHALVYPDGEVLRYGYDSGGQVRSAVGVQDDARYDYLLHLGYDKFGQRVQQELGNGVVTTYAYRADNRRLQQLTAGPTGGSAFQHLHYGYDPVGNVLALDNRVAVPRGGAYGGPVTQRFGYDDLYRLTTAEGSVRTAPNRREHYTLELAFDAIHNITAKAQTHVREQPSGQTQIQRGTSYDWTYGYQGAQPHAPTHIGERVFRYDANGNQTGWESSTNGTRRSLDWDEENRLLASADNGRTTRYVYDAGGERVIKRGAQGETAYVNAYYTVRNRSIATRHVFVGESRLASRLTAGVAPASEARPGRGNARARASLRNPRFGAHPGRGLANRSDRADERARNTAQNPHLQDGDGEGEGHAPPHGNFLYYYHPDHLGSSSFVTDAQGALYEHVQYFPFGELWVDQRSERQRLPYLFTGKELDEETGLYYFGARYYDPRTSVWQSSDPILEEYLPSVGGKQPSGGGVFRSANLNMYAYAYQNPVILIDPNGERPLTKGEVELATSIFGTSINYSEVEVYQERFAGIIPVPSDRAMAPNGNIYFHPDNPYYSDDFSSESMDSKGLFVHEMTHVWQHQSGESVIGRGIFQRDYGYDLTTSESFDDYGLEAQGNLIMDYFFRSEGHRTSAWGSQSRDPRNTPSAYRSVLQEFLSNPSYLRERNEQRMEERSNRMSQGNQ